MRIARHSAAWLAVIALHAAAAPVEPPGAAATSLALPPAQTRPFGTLFYSPQERERLDKLRRGEPPEPVAASGPVASRNPVVTGYVQRSDGRNTVWIDGRAVAVASPKAAPIFDPSVVQVPGESPAPLLRAEPKGKRR